MTDPSAPEPGAATRFIALISRATDRWAVLKHLPLLLILLLAFGFRSFGRNWDEGHLLHPDERHMAMVTAALERPESLSEWLDGDTSSFTPYAQGINSYVYGQLPLIPVHALTVQQGDRDLKSIVRAGRRMSAWLSTATVLLVYAFGLRLLSLRAAQLTALLQTGVILSIQQAHFYTVDTAGTFFATACVGFGLLAAKEKKTAWLFLSAAMVGLAMACRINLGLLAFWVTALAGIISFQQRSLRLLTGWVLGGVCSLLLFRLLQPMAFSGWGLNPQWVEDLRMVHDISRGILEVPFTLQWAGRTPYLYALNQLIRFSIGLPLGLLALAGLGVCLGPLRHRQTDWRVFAALWPLMLFLYHGRIFLHTQRYFLPAIPILILCAVIAGHAVRPVRLARILAGVTLAATLLTALAFSNLYRSPHPRIEASDWLYDRLPAGGTVLTEHWDDALPLRLDGQADAHGRITIDQAEVYLPETPEKLRRILQQIDQAQYLVLSSTRASHSLPRMPLRYPVMTRFYESLGDPDRLPGLREAARFHRAPALAGFRIDSLAAEEAYRVYDHPLVRIYEVTPAFDADAAFLELTQGIDFTTIPQIPYLQAGNRNGGWLTPAQLERRASGPRWGELFSPDALGARRPVLICCLVLFILGPLSFPLTFFLFPTQFDRGASVSRLFGLCLLAWAAWLPAALEILPFQTSLLMAAMAGFGLSAYVCVWKAEPLSAWLKTHWRRLLPGECLCWILFAAFLLLRTKQPELWHPWSGGEKPMDFAFLNATTLTPFFPPQNPWLSGAFLHYYYYGFVLVSVLIHLTGIPPEIAVNLALATFALFTAGGAYAIGCALYPLFKRSQGWRGAVITGVGSAFLVLIPGNLAQVREFLTGSLSGNLRNAYWNASRALKVPPGEVEPITEFPFFSHLYGDLHAHLMAMPIAMLCLLISWQLLRRFHPLRVASLALVLGSLWITNTWDLPVQAAVFLFACLFPGWRDRAWGARLFWAVAGLLLAQLLFAPFHQQFSPPPLVFRFWDGPRSRLLDLVLVHGLFLIPLFAGGVLWIRSPRRKALAAHLFPLLLVTGCIVLIVMLEILHMKGDIGRMNFVFKFTYQVWWILACCAALVIQRFAGRRHPVFTGITLLLTAGALLYPLTAVPAKLNEWKWHSPKHSLDGMAYLETAVWQMDGHPVPLAGDKAAMEWLRQHADPGSVLLEGLRPPYQWGGRISWHTGLPAVLGWDWHMRQQRAWPGGEDAVFRRQRDIQHFFASADPAILRRYGVRYVILGELERLTYGEAALAHIRRLPTLTRVFTLGGTAVYEVKN